jgi:hypothetical protein
MTNIIASEKWTTEEKILSTVVWSEGRVLPVLELKGAGPLETKLIELVPEMVQALIATSYAIEVGEGENILPTLNELIERILKLDELSEHSKILEP